MSIQFAGGTVPAVIQDKTSGKVLMVGYMNEAAFRKTQETGKVTFYSRSRKKLWTKGESSGHWLHLKEILVDCDEDTLLILVDPLGPGTCHKGYRSCFYRKLGAEGEEVIAPRVFDPQRVYESGTEGRKP